MENFDQMLWNYLYRYDWWSLEDVDDITKYIDVQFKWKLDQANNNSRQTILFEHYTNQLRKLLKIVKALIKYKTA